MFAKSVRTHPEGTLTDSTVRQSVYCYRRGYIGQKPPYGRTYGLERVSPDGWLGRLLHRVIKEVGPAETVVH